MFPNDINIVISNHYIKQNTSTILKEVSNSISINETEYLDSNKSDISKDVINKVKEDAKKIRYEIQINNQEIYKVYTYIRISSEDKEKLFIMAQDIRTRLITKMLKVNTLNFRHLIGFISTSPFCYSSRFLSNYFVNMTTSNVKVLFPFYTQTIIEKNGVLFGKTKNDNKVCVMDIFNKNHLNYNICIFGSSGSGKSYFTKLLILRNYIKNINQYIIDPEGEYFNLPATRIKLNEDRLNLLQIFESEVREKFLEYKINKVSEFICNICEIKEHSEIIIKNLYDTYSNAGITEDINSLYVKENKLSLNSKFKDSSYFPCIDNLKESIKNDENIKQGIKNNILKKLKFAFDGVYKFLNGITNVYIDSEIVIFDISNVGEKEKKEICKFLLSYINERIKYNNKTLIYIDEVWKLIYDDEELFMNVFNLYKTLRKRNAGIVTITQDVSDMFNKGNGSYGKSIFNNSNIKLFFKTDYNESNILKNIGLIEDKEYDKMLNLKKGEVLMYFANSSLMLQVEANDYEKKIMEGEIFSDSTSCK